MGAARMTFLGWLLLSLAFILLAKLWHLWPGLPGPHTWDYTHTTYERFVALDTRKNAWVDQSRDVRHFSCKGRYCSAVTHD